jgi:betaine-aldehyde dehydrogenase
MLTDGVNGAHAPLPNIQDCLPKNLKLFYNGQWNQPHDGEYRETFNPGNGKVIDKVAFAGVADTKAAIEAAQRAFPSWRATPPIQRGKLLKKAAQVLRDHATELALIDSYNTGNPISEMLNDANGAAEHIDFFAGLIPAVHGETTSHLTDDSFNYTLREPLGVISRIVASNHPVMFTGFKLAAPLAMGNTVIIKSPEQAPLSGLRLMELIGDIFPPGVLNLLHGGPECGKTLSSHPLVKKITLVGSLPTGIAVQKAAAATLKPSTLELGGKNALLAYPDADLDVLVEGIVRGMNFSWCGQSCGSMSRVFLHESHHDKVLELVKEKVELAYRPGVPTDPATTMGSLVSKAAQERVLGYIAVGKEEGARVVTGGKVPSTKNTKGGFFVEATIFADVTQSMRIAREEIFGPVMSVLKWTNEEDLIEQANSVEYGLTASIFTSSIKKAHETVRRVEAGCVWVNTVATHYFGTPFGGYKQSGLGREDCFEELVSMTQVKAVNFKL